MALFSQENQNSHYYMDKAKPITSQIKKSMLKGCTQEIRRDSGRAVWIKWTHSDHTRRPRFVEARLDDALSAEPPTTIMHLSVSSVSTSTHT